MQSTFSRLAGITWSAFSLFSYAGKLICDCDKIETDSSELTLSVSSIFSASTIFSGTSFLSVSSGEHESRDSLFLHQDLPCTFAISEIKPAFDNWNIKQVTKLLIGALSRSIISLTLIA